MPTLSGGLNIALQGILASSQAIEIIEHNVSNANTKGYHRQGAMMSATVASPAMGYESGYLAGQRGSGVTIDKIDRFNLQFFDDRFRAISSDTTQWQKREEILTQLESTLSETTSDGLIPKMDQFWSSWSNLAADPTNAALRAQILNNGASLALSFQSRIQQLNQMRSDQNLAISDQTSQINQIASQIADLNQEISRVQAINEQPNDLRDKRDLLLDQLAEITGAVSFEQQNGAVNVSINGHDLVTGNTVNTLSTTPDPVTHLNNIFWSDGQQLVPQNGSLKGLFQVRDSANGGILNQINGLNSLANTLITQVNTLHQSGYDLTNTLGQAFFTGTDATNIQVNAALSTDNIAIASAANQPGNSDMADLLAGLRNAKVMNGGTTTMDDYYNAQITSLGMELQTAKNNSTHQSLIQQALGDQRQSVAGVNLNEEAADMVKYQRAYEAASRIMTAYDDMLNKVINGMGRVGL
jgi:flagellar hook-associated protein 1